MDKDALTLELLRLRLAFSHLAPDEASLDDVINDVERVRDRLFAYNSQAAKNTPNKGSTQGNLFPV